MLEPLKKRATGEMRSPAAALSANPQPSPPARRGAGPPARAFREDAAGLGGRGAG